MKKAMPQGVYQKNGGYYFHVSYQRRQLHRRRESLRDAILGREEALERIGKGLSPFDDEVTAEVPIALRDFENETVATVVSNYLAARSEMRVAPRYRLCADHLRRHMGALPAGLDEQALRRYVAARKKEGVVNETVRIEFRFLRAALRYWKKEALRARVSVIHVFETIDKQDMASMLPKEAPAHEYRRTSAKKATKTFEDVIALLPERFHAPLRLARYIGARKGEVFGLLWREVREDRLEFTDRVKCGKARTVYLSGEALAVIPEKPADASDDDLVFPGPRGRSMYNSVQERWKAARESVGATVHLHDMRREFISARVEEGYSLKEVGEVAGQSTLAVTSLYTKSAETRQRQMMAGASR